MTMRFVCAILAVLLTMPGLTGCALTVPVEGTHEASRHENAGLAGDTLVTVGPRRLLELLAQRIAASDPRLEVVDALRFRDTAYPQGGWRLHELLAAGTRDHIARNLPVDYLVLVSPLVYSVGDENGFFVPLVAGAQSAEHKSSLSATIYDMASGRALCRVDASASGTERVLSYVILFTGTTPHVVAPVVDALVKEIIQAIESAGTRTRPRIAILAAEPALQEPMPAPAQPR
ncbi:MAG: hypothetical protein HGA75_09280 [Thiobacillus sp.]|nr:hypothetical protein [Thiobacillus sp.]